MERKNELLLRGEVVVGGKPWRKSRPGRPKPADRGLWLKGRGLAFQTCRRRNHRTATCRREGCLKETPLCKSSYETSGIKGQRGIAQTWNSHCHQMTGVERPPHAEEPADATAPPLGSLLEQQQQRHLRPVRRAVSQALPGGLTQNPHFGTSSGDLCAHRTLEA